MANFEDWNWETIIRDNIGLYLTTATYLASREIEIGEKIRKIRAITLFKVIEVGTNRKPVCDFLLVITEFFSLGVAAEALQVKIDRKSAISLRQGQFDPKF